MGVIVLVTWINPWSFIPAGIATVAMLFLRHHFAPCSRDLQRLSSTLRSPIYSYLTSTINGLKVIRSYRAEKTCRSDFFGHLDDHTRATYLLCSANRWAAIRFDWIALFFFAVVISLALAIRVAGGHFSPADIALTLAYTFSLVGVLQWTIRFVSAVSL